MAVPVRFVAVPFSSCCSMSVPVPMSVPFASCCSCGMPVSVPFSSCCGMPFAVSMSVPVYTHAFSHPNSTKQNSSSYPVSLHVLSLHLASAAAPCDHNYLIPTHNQTPRSSKQGYLVHNMNKRHDVQRNTITERHDVQRGTMTERSLTSGASAFLMNKSASFTAPYSEVTIEAF